MAVTSRFTKSIWQLMSELLKAENTERALSESLDIIVKALNSEAGTIWLLNPDTKTLHPVLSAGAVDIKDASVSVGSGTEGVVTRDNRSVLIPDVSKDPVYSGTVLDQYGIKASSLLCVPLTNNSKSMGCIVLINKTDGTKYDNDDLVLCEQMAALTAMTITEKGIDIERGEKKDVLVKLQNVTKNFANGDSELQVLKGINLELYRNEFCVVLGESGCGKSTLMNIIGGMDFLTDGKMFVEGRDCSRLSEKELTKFRRDYIGFIFQSYNLMPNLTAIENVRFIAELVDNPLPSEEAIAKVKLSDRSGNYPGQMSGGQQQRVSIARAIVKKPKLILADEPTAALDYQTSIEVLSVIEDIVRTQGTTVMMVTHNREIAKMADRVINIKDGKVSGIRRNMYPLHAKDLTW